MPGVDLIEQVLADLTGRGFAATTIRLRRQQLRRIELDLGRPLIGVTVDDIDEWARRRRPELSAPSWNQELASLRTFFRHVVDHDLRADDPTRRLRRARVPRRAPRPMPTHTFEATLAATVGPLDRVCLLLGWDAGLRCAEVAGLSWSDIDMGRRRLRVLGKGGKERTVPISERLYAEILAAGVRRGPMVLDAHGRPISAAALDKRLNRLLPRPFTFHQLRHSFGTRAANAPGVKAQVVRDLMGHSNLATTSLYVASRADDLAPAVEAASREEA